jgi:NAD(P)-dependent dehydrogenase (short-subunit alcohol dehydrogenase family)
MILKDKVILVTGASEGIGFEIAKQLTEAGAKVIGISRNIESKGINSFEVKNCDVSKPEQVSALLEWISTTHNGLDIVVNNAGVWQKMSQVDNVSDETIKEVIDVNLKGTIFVTKYALRLLRKSKEGLIVNISSKSGVEAKPEQSVYVASKYGVRGFTDVLREDLAESSIHVMGVYQGGINTQMFAKANDQKPIEKFTEPDDLAAQIVFAMSAPKKLWVHELRIGYK